MKNAEQMIADLQSVFEELRAGQIKCKDAAELANVAGKMIGLSKVKLEYHALRKESPRIDFLESRSST